MRAASTFFLVVSRSVFLTLKLLSVCARSCLSHVLVPDRLSFAWTWALGSIWEAIKRDHPGPQGDGEPSAKKRSVAHSTFVKWQAESWLDCEVSMSGAKKIVAKLKCKVCVKFKSKIAGRRNYSNK